jgi:hypothetical protein
MGGGGEGGVESLVYVYKLEDKQSLHNSFVYLESHHFLFFIIFLIKTYYPLPSPPSL